MSIPSRALRPRFTELLYGMLLQRLWADWLRSKEDWADMESRRLELVCGVLGGALSLTALGIELFAPLESECGATDPSGPTTCVSVSMVHMQVPEILWVNIILFGGLSLGIILSAVWHSLLRSLPTLVLLWVCTTPLCLQAILSLTSPLRVVVVPAAMLALAASIAGTVAAQQRVPAHV